MADQITTTVELWHQLANEATGLPAIIAADNLAVTTQQSLIQSLTTQRDALNMADLSPADKLAFKQQSDAAQLAATAAATLRCAKSTALLIAFLC